MKHLMKKTLALLLCVAMLCAALPPASAALEPDFQALLTAGSTGQNVIYTVTDPICYTAEVNRFVGDYAIYKDISSGATGILDYKGNVVFSPSTGDMAPQNVFGYNLFRGYDGYLYDFQGNKLYENQVGPSVGPLEDNITGELRGYWIALDYGNGYVLREDGGQQETVYRFGGLYNGILLYGNDFGKRGLKMLFGEELLPCVYDELSFLSGDTLFYRKDGKCGLMRTDATVIKEFDYNAVILNRTMETTNLIVSKDGKYGVCTLEGDVLIPLEYDSISSCNTYGFRFRGSIDGISYYISEDENLTFCGTRNFPTNLSPLFENVYFIVLDGEAAVVNGNNERLLPESFNTWTYGMIGDCIALLPLGSDVTQLYNEELQLVAELPGQDYAYTQSSLVRTAYGNGGTNSVCFYGADGELLAEVPNAGIWSCHDDNVILQRNGKLALASWNGTLVTDFTYDGVEKVSSGTESVKHPYFLVMTDEGMQIIDGRTGKNALGENCYVQEMAYLLPEGSYFAYYKDGKTGFAKLTSRDEPPFRDVSPTAWYSAPATFCNNAGIITGTGAGVFAPKKEMSRAMLVQVLYSISGERTESFGFADVPDGKWYSDAVNWAASKGIVTGTSATTFSPHKTVTREQMVTILYQYASTFGPMTADQNVLAGYEDLGSVAGWAKDPFAWAVANGVITGSTAATLNPKGTANRAQAATVLMRFVEYMASVQ